VLLTYVEVSRTKQAEKIKEELQTDNSHIFFRTDKTKYEKHLKNALKEWNRKGCFMFCDLLHNQYTEQEFQEKVEFFNRFYVKKNLLFTGRYDSRFSIVEVKKMSYK